jgi:hypothetical protein
MADQSSEEKAAYARLEEAIKEVGRLEGSDGVLTEWAVLATVQRYDGDGDGITQVLMLLPDGGGQTPHHRIMGLLDFQLTRMRAEISQEER